MQYGFHFDADSCTGCKACALACRDKNNTPVGIKFRKVVDYAGGNWTVADGIVKADGVFNYSVSLSCMHCANPACVTVCPTGAMAKNPDTGIVTTDHEICIACGSCRKACPYDAPRVMVDLGYTNKCNMCEDLVAAGEKPACISSCPMRCLDFGPLDELIAKYGDNRDLAPLPDSSTTEPSFLIKPSRYAEGAANGKVTNSAEEID